MTIRITILGCAGSFAGADQVCTGYMIQAAGKNVLLDCGSGVLAQWQRHLPLSEIDAVVTTHCHPDHWLDLPVLRNALRYVLLVERVPVYGTAETHGMARTLLDDELAPTFDWTTIDETSEVTIGEQRWTFSRTDHPVETLACRVDVGETSFAFSSDTGPGWDVGALGPDIDLFLCEASLPNDQEGLAPHLSGGQAGTMARANDVGRLVITHIVPGNDGALHRSEAEVAYGAAVDLAEIGATFEV